MSIISNTSNYNNNNFDFQSYTKKPTTTRRDYYYSKEEYDLPDEIWFKIFLLLSFESIHKNRCVSKQWLSLLSNSSFMNNYYKVNTPFMFFTSYLCSNKGSTSFMLKLYEEDSKFLSNCDKALVPMKFHSAKYPNIKTDRYFLDSGNGLVLSSNKTSNQMTYFVCNPLTRKWVSLERKKPQFRHKDVLIGFISEPSTTSLVPPLLLSSSSPSSKSSRKKKFGGANFMVVRVPFKTGRFTDFTMEIFYSELSEWKSFNVSCPQQVTFKPSRSNIRIVKCNGILYWFVAGNQILAYNLNDNSGENLCKLICLPVKTFEDDRYLGESDGFIYFCKITVRRLSVWVFLDPDWRLVHKSKRLPIVGLDVICINPVDPNVLFLKVSGIHVHFSYNIKTERFELLVSPKPNRLDDVSFVLVPRSTKL